MDHWGWEADGGRDRSGEEEGRESAEDAGEAVDGEEEGGGVGDLEV